jgi:WD40 repeat protein/tRNA A-37 threonylcarbamoyl transferase component Bud32
MSSESTTTGEREQRWGQVLVACLEALEKGPGLDRQGLLARYPEFTSELEVFFAQREHVGQAVVPLSPVGGASGALPRCFGDYELLEELGQGGMGVVYKARQKSLNRLVALKMIRAGSMACRADLQRFRAEAEAAASLDHPHIVPIYEVGELQGQPYFTMKLVNGHRLTEHLPSLMTDPRASAQLLVAVAHAVHHAHQRGILHRDLKPSNILRDLEGRPHVTDFGLAKRVEADGSLTQTGLLVGTPSYMAPEQATAQRGAITTATDVYGLGAVLYVLLTGRPPFRGDSVLDTLEQVKQQEPKPPHASNRQLDRDLETICLKCLQKDPGDRYSSALTLAEDLERYLAGQPIHARRGTVWHRVILWAKRRPAQAAALLISGIAALALIVAGLAVFYNAKLQQSLEETDRARQTAVTQEQRATKALDEAQFHQYFHYLARANAGWQSENMGQVEKLLDACAAERRGWEWHYLKGLCHAELLTLRGHHGSVEAVAFSPDGTWLASCAGDGVRIWDATTGQAIRTLAAHDGITWSLTVSRDGTRLATAGEGGTVKVWDATTWRWITTCKDATGRAHDNSHAWGVAFSPDGSRLVSIGMDTNVKVWDATTGRPIQTLQGHTSPVVGIAYSPDGTRIASAGFEGVVIVWDACTGKPLHRIAGVTNQGLLTFSPDGTLLAAAAASGAVRVWSLRTGQDVLTLKGHKSSVRSLCFSPDGARLASSRTDGAIKVWDLSTGQLVFTYLGHTGEVKLLAFSPDGSRLASASTDQTVKIWNATTGPGPRTVPAHASALLRVVFSPDGSRLASSGRDGKVKVWDVTTGQELLRLEANFQFVWGIAFSPDGARILSTGPDARINVWGAHTGQEMPPLKGHHAEVRTLSFSPDGSLLASAGDDCTVKLWDANSGQVLRTLTGHIGGIRGVAFSRDGTRLVSASWDKTVRLWDPTTGQLLRTLEGHATWIQGLAFHPDSTRLASASHDGTVNIWDARTGQRVLPPLAGPTSGVYSVTFSPDGSRLASANQDGTVRVWDVATGEETLLLQDGLQEVGSVAFSPDGMRLASASTDGTIKIWDARPWMPAVVTEREALGVLDYLFARPLCKADVCEYLRTSATITPEARQLALSLVERYREETNPERYYQASWAILRQPYLNAFQYRCALRQAATACRLAPENSLYRTALGVAQYCAGQVPDALDILERADQRASGHPAALAFLAMAQQRVGRKNEARSTLSRLRQVIEEPCWSEDAEMHGFVREAEALIPSR